MTDPNHTPGHGERGTGEGAGDRLRQTGREAVSDATSEVRGRLERGKSTAADTAASTSEVLDHAADEFYAQGQESLARATSMLAGRLSGLATQLETRSLDELTRDARELARRNPGLFVAGGVAIGLALSRFFKASAPSRRSDGGSPQWSGGAAYGGEGALPDEGSFATQNTPVGTEGPGSRATPATSPTTSPTTTPTNSGIQGGRHE